MNPSMTLIAGTTGAGRMTLIEAFLRSRGQPELVYEEPTEYLYDGDVAPVRVQS